MSAKSSTDVAGAADEIRQTDSGTAKAATSMPTKGENAMSMHRAQMAPSTGAARPPTSQLFSRGNLVSSRVGGDKIPLARPSTAVRAVGYAANSSSAGERFDHYLLKKASQQALTSTHSSADAAKEVNPQIKYRNLEAKIIKLLESSILLAASSWKAREIEKVGVIRDSGAIAQSEIKTNFAEALNKAKEAFSLDRTLHRFRDQHGEDLFHNFELTYAVLFNLAEQYENNEMNIEALNTYSIMTKNKMFPHVNQLKLNMGNVYHRMGMYPKAIKMYRMALDSVPSSLKQLRLRITHNIGTLFVRMGQYADAASSFEYVMSERADVRSGIHLILCYYAMGDVDKMRSTFRNLCDAQTAENENELENESHLIKLQQQQNEQQQQELLVVEQQHMTMTHQHQPADEPFTTESINRRHSRAGPAEDINDSRQTWSSKLNAGDSHYVFQALKNDELGTFLKQRRNIEKRSITMIVNLISPIIEENYNDGYNWCIEVIKNSNLSWLASELELNKALVYLRQNDINQAIETLQMYDKKSEGRALTASALTNLTFIYINLGNLEMATHCVNQLNEIGALQSSSMALVNASIIDYNNQNFEAARTKLEHALQIQPDSLEANYNLGLVALKEKDLILAEEQFLYLKNHLGETQSVQHPHVFYKLAQLQEQLHGGESNRFEPGTTPTALRSYLQVLGISAADDSRLFEKIGSFYERCQDHQQANQYYNEAYRINPSDIDIATSIGSYFIQRQATERAVYYYERAVLANPNDANLMLRVASCFRHSYLPPKQYLGMFEKIYARFPDNLTCVRALVQVTKSLGLTEQHEKYSMEAARLFKLHHARDNEQKQQQQRLSSGRASSRFRAIKNSNGDSNLTRGISLENTRISRSMAANLDEELNARRTNATSEFTVNHIDPLGPPAERPRTGVRTNSVDHDSEDEEMSAESLLPI